MKNTSNIKSDLRRWLLFVGFLGLASCGPTERSSEAKVEEAKDGTKWQTGIALYSFNHFPFPATLDMAKKAEAKNVEGFFFHNLGEEFDNRGVSELSDGELDKMKEMLVERELAMSSMYAGGTTVDEWIRMYEIGERLGLEFLVGEPEPEHWDLLDSLGRATGLKMAIHEHAKGSSRFWHPDSVLLALKGRQTFKACGDLGHWVRSGLDPVECLQKLEGHLVGIHAKDLDEFGNLEANDVKLSTGVIDYPAVIKELNRQEFEGPIYVECEHDWENNFEDVRYAVEYLEALK